MLTLRERVRARQTAGRVCETVCVFSLRSYIRTLLLTYNMGGVVNYLVLVGT